MKKMCHCFDEYIPNKCCHLRPNLRCMDGTIELIEVIILLLKAIPITLAVILKIIEELSYLTKIYFIGDFIDDHIDCSYYLRKYDEWLRKIMKVKNIINI